MGAGGGFILVPALLLFVNMPPQIAVGTALIIVFINALSGSWAYIKQKRVDYKLTKYLVIGAIPGSFIGLQLAKVISPDLFYQIFAGLLILFGIYLLFKNSSKQELPRGETIIFTSKVNMNLIGLGIVMGMISTFFGIGGGWLLVPVLIYLFQIAPHYATATSIFSLCIYSLAGGLLHIYSGNVDWNAIIWGGTGAIIGSQIGAYLSNKISGKIILQMLSFLLIIIGIRLFF